MCDCHECEQLLQGYLDRQLTEAEVLEAEEHLDLKQKLAALRISL